MITERRYSKMLFILIVHILVMIQIVCFIIIPDISYAASGATYYVSTVGNDSNNGTFAAPWKTIQKACNTVVAGDTVCIKAGTYKGKITVPVCGTANAYRHRRYYFQEHFAVPFVFRQL